MWMSGCWRWLVIVGVMLACAPRPASAAEVATTEQLRRWVVGLRDADPATREKSKHALLGLRREELPTLAAVVHDFRPLEPTVVGDMREIVEHVYLSGDEYPKEEMGFIGIHMPETPAPKLEVVVESRMPGFAGFRMLQDGDAILDIEEYPLAQPVDRRAFCAKVLRIKPRELIHLRVLRRGKIIRVPGRLDPRPKDPSGAGVDYDFVVQELLARRAAEADGYWKRVFEREKAPGERTATVEPK